MLRDPFETKNWLLMPCKYIKKAASTEMWCLIVPRSPNLQVTHQAPGSYMFQLLHWAFMVMIRYFVEVISLSGLGVYGYDSILRRGNMFECSHQILSNVLCSFGGKLNF